MLVLVFAGARPDNWVGEAIVVATPSKVAIGIRNAIKSGWAADGRGTTFYAIASGQLGKSEPHVTGRGLDATPTSGEAAYDPSWLVQLARAQCPELTWLPSALQKCTKLDRAERAYLYFVNPKSTQWRFDYNIFLESPEHGRLILDILKQELVGGVEFLNRI